MKRKLSFAVLAALGAFVLVLLSGVPLPYPAHAQASPSVAVSLSSDTVEEGSAITVTMSFGGLESDADTATRDYVFRADVMGADECEDRANGYGLGVDRYMYQVDEDPETRTGTISADCPAGDYTLEASISSPDSVELASARASFTVTAPAPTPTPEPTPLVAIALFPSSSVEQGTAIAVTMGFIGLQSDWDTGTTDYIFRADVVGADACEGDGLGVDRYMYQVDDDPETRTGTISAGCPAGDYTLEASISSSDGVKLASARAGFRVAEPEEEEDDPPDSARQQSTPVDITFASENGSPRGIWSDGTTVWVVDAARYKLYAYSLSGGARDSGKDITLDGANRNPNGVWSDGTTIWVADASDAKLYAHALSGGARDSGKDITLNSANGNASGVWSDGTTIWVADKNDRKLYAYALSNGNRDTAKEFSVRQGSQRQAGVWADGTTMWVVYQGFNKALAYTISSGSRNAGLDLSLRISSNNWGAWSDGTTMWVGNSGTGNQKLFHHPLPGTSSTDAALSDLSVSGVTLEPTFSADTTSYTASVANSVTSTTVTATTNDAAASVLITPTDADANRAGDQVNLDVGSNTISVKVTAEDGTTTQTYTMTITRADPPRDVVAVPADWTLKPSGLGVGDQFRLLIVTSTTRNANSTDISDYDTHVQTAVAAGHAGIQSHSSQFKVLGCTAAVDARDHTGTTYTSADKGVPIYWLDGNKAADEYEDFYDGSWDEEATGKNESGTDVSFPPPSYARPHTGCGHDGTESFFGSTSYALGLSLVRVARANAAGQGPLSSNSATGSGNARPFYGLSAVFQVAGAATPPTLSGLTVSAGTLTPAFAGGTLEYAVPDVPNATGRITVTATPETGAAVTYEDGSGNTLTDADAGTAGFQTDLEVGENTIKVKVTKGGASQTYTLKVTRAAPAASSDASLSGLALSGVTLDPVFAGATTGYTASVYNSVESTTVTATPNHAAATVVITPVDDADLSAEGYQVSLDVGSNVVSVKVTAEDGTTTRTYTVTVTRAANSATVVVTAPDGATDGTRAFEVTWVDTQDCTDGYKAYLGLVSNGVVVGATEIVDDATGTADVITATYDRLVNVGVVQVWCGERGSGRMVGEVAVPSNAATNNRVIPGRYSSAAGEPPTLSGLTVSAGTLTPTFAGGTLEYAVPGLAYGHNRITVTATADADATVSYEDGAGAALSDVDAATAGDQFDLAVGENTIKVRVTEGGLSQTYTLTLTRTAPAVSVSAAAGTAGEGDALTFTVTRTPAAGDALTLTVNVAESGDLVPAASEGAYPVTIAANATAATMTVATGADDSDWEEHSTVSVTASPSTGYTLGAASASTLVEDDDFPAATAHLVVSPASVSEPGTARVTVSVTTQRNEMPHGPGGTLTVVSSDVTASAGSDYDTYNQSYALDAAGFSAITIGGGRHWWREYSGTVTVREDTTQESAETFHLVLTKSGAPKVTLALSTAAVTIPANDAPAAPPALSGLTVSAGTLTPDFASGTLEYAVPDVPNADGRIIVTATADADVTVAYEDGSGNTLTDADADTAGFQADLVVGENTIKVKVTKGGASCRPTR